MDLTFSDTQQSLAQSARAFLERQVPFERQRKLELGDLGYDDGLWSAMVTQGWMEVPFAATAKTDLGHLGVLLREFGRWAFVSPYFQSVAAAGITAHHLGDTALATQLVSRISQGERGVLVATADPTRTAAGRLDGATATFSGGPFIVEWAHLADFLICPVLLGDNDFMLFALDPGARGVEVQPHLTIDHERVASVSFQEVVADGDRRLTGELRPLAELHDALALVGLLRAVEMTGGVRQALDMTVRHVQTRHQFGRALGNFQAVQHICADMLSESDGAHMAVWEALMRAETGLPFQPYAALATYFTGRAYERVTQQAAQLHGGIGFMSEYQLQHHFRRAKAQRMRLGAPALQLENVARHLVDRVAESGRFATRVLSSQGQLTDRD